jgi:hypothetical protein
MNPPSYTQDKYKEINYRISRFRNILLYFRAIHVPLYRFLPLKKEN